MRAVALKEMCALARRLERAQAKGERRNYVSEGSSETVTGQTAIAMRRDQDMCVSSAPECSTIRRGAATLRSGGRRCAGPAQERSGLPSARDIAVVPDLLLPDHGLRAAGNRSPR